MLLFTRYNTCLMLLVRGLHVLVIWLLYLMVLFYCLGELYGLLVWGIVVFKLVWMCRLLWCDVVVLVLVFRCCFKLVGLRCWC